MMSLSPEELITQGRRDLVCGDIPKAVENFQKACEILSGEFGDFDEKLAVPNLLYGTALLELSRIESTVIGNALDGIPEDESDDSGTDDELIEEGPELTSEEKEDLSNKVIDAMCDEEPSKDSTEANPTEQGDHKADSDEICDTNQDSAPNEADKQESEEDNKSSEDEDEQEENDDEEEGQVKESEKDEAEGGNKSDDEDISNLQIAWEVIEVAKKIFSRNDDTNSRLKVAECFEKLGEISREKEDYTQAISDLKECLTIRSSILANDDRDIAETHFQLGTTYAVSGDLDSASQSFRASADCLVQYVNNVKAKLAEKSGDEDEETKLLRSSLTEVEELIPEIQRRCADVEEDRMAEKMKPGCSSMDETELPSDPSKPVSDISHLVRKKRPITGDVPHTNGTNEDDTSKATNGNDELSPHSKKLKLAHTNGTTPEAVPNGLENASIVSQDHISNGN